MSTASRFTVALFAVLLASNAYAAPPPHVSSVFPTRQDIDAPANAPITVTFDTAVDPSTFNAISFRAFGRWSGPATGNIQVNGSVAVFTPDEPFFAGEYVTVSLSRAIESAQGQSMPSGYAWSYWVKSGVGTLDLDYLTRYDTRRQAESWVQPYGAYAGDLDNDGWTDLVVPCETGNDVRIFMNNGAGLYPGGFTVKEPSNLNRPSPNEPADFDNDGEIDLAVGNVNNDRLTVMFGDGAGDFPTVVSVDVSTGAGSVRGVGVLDLNGDGWDDVVVACRAANHIARVMNNGDGTFAPAVAQEIGVELETSIVVADANNDGIMDVFVGNNGIPRQVTVLICDGNGGLVPQTPVATSGGPWMLAVGDLNLDGNVDVFSAASTANGIGCHLGNGAGGISAVTFLATGGYPLAIDAGDLDGDGDLELVSSNYNSASWTVWENAGNGTFINARTLAASSAGSCATLHDRDNDGDLDLTGLDEIDDWVYVYENNAPPTHVPSIQSAAVTMSQNHPNPFNPSTTIRFELARAGDVTISVYDATGAFVAAIANRRYEAGEHDVRWNGTDAAGTRVASGLYFYRLVSNGVELTRKMTLLK